MVRNQYDAAAEIADILSGLTAIEVKRAVLMALVGIGKSRLLEDPATISVVTVSDWQPGIPKAAKAAGKE